MSKILEFIDSSTTGKLLLNRDFSIKLYHFLRSLYSVENYVKNVELRDTFYSPYFAYYIPELKKLYINFEKTMDDINRFIGSLDLEEQDKTFATSLCLFHVINHEFKHICQEKLKDEQPNSLESRLLVLSNEAEKRYASEGILFYKYQIDPIERQAELSSLIELISMAKSRKLFALVKEMEKRYQEDAKAGYHGYLHEYPAKTFIEFSEVIDCKIKPLFEELDEFPVTSDNLDYRIELGLRTNTDEYNKLLKK